MTVDKSGLRKRKPYTTREIDLEGVERLDLQSHLIEAHGTWIDGSTERLESQHEWCHRFFRSQG